MSFSFNLIEKPCFPILKTTGEVAEESICGIFEKADEIRELQLESPLMHPTALRLLLAILHRGWNSDSEASRYKEWQQWWKARRFTDKVFAYLDQQKAKFDLFDAEQPFYQTPHLKVLSAKDAQKSILQLLLNQGNNPTLFDHNTEANPPLLSPAEAMRALLVGQAYLTAGTGSPNVEINSIKRERPGNFSQGHLLNAASIWLNGGSLFETLMLNLCPVDADEDDKPVWEKSVTQQIKEATSMKRNQTFGPMERFTFQSRLILLLPEEVEGQLGVRRVLFAQGRIPDDVTPDEMKAYQYRKVKNEEKSLPVGLNADKAAWRDAHAIFSMEKTSYRPAALGHVAEAISQMPAEEQNKMGNKRLRLNVAGVANDQAKILLWRLDKMPAPTELLDDLNLAETLEPAIAEAQFVADAMNMSFRRVARLFLAPNCEEPDAAQPDSDNVTRIANSFDPRRAFWPRLEAPFYQFLLDLPNDRHAALDKWRDVVEKEATRCFDAARRELGTSPRALRTAVVPAVFLTKARLDAKRIEDQQRKAAQNKANSKREVIA